MRIKLFMGAAVAPLVMAGAAFAQDADQEGPVTAVEDVIVTGQPALRNRTDDVVPTLSYDLDYFQRFEPLTVGDALKRVPSVTFLSDVLERVRKGQEAVHSAADVRSALGLDD